jgi:hypothetical protein
MSASINTTAAIRQPRHGHAWRDDRGQAHGSTYIGEYSSLTFGTPAEARELAAAVLATAEAMEALPPVQQEGGQP